MTKLKEGLFPGIPIEDYHNWEKHPAISSSLINIADKKTMLHFKATIDGEAENEKKPLIFGNIAHDILLQNSISDYVLQPPKRINEQGKEVNFVRSGKHWDEFLKEAEGRPILKEDELEQLTGMHTALMNSEIANTLIFHSSDVELSGFWHEPEYDLWGKCRFDIISHELKVVGDYKSVADASPEKFSKSFYNYGYDIQCAWYDRGLKKISKNQYDFVYIVQEKDPPYAVCCYRIPRADGYTNDDGEFIITGKGPMEIGQIKIEKALANISHSFRENTWPGYPELTLIKELSWEITKANDILRELKEKTHLEESHEPATS